jgi:hypothetical protein
MSHRPPRSIHSDHTFVAEYYRALLAVISLLYTGKTIETASRSVGQRIAPCFPSGAGRYNGRRRSRTDNRANDLLIFV